MTVIPMPDPSDDLPMNALPEEVEAEYRRVKSMTPHQRRESLKESLGISAAHLLRLAIHIRVMEENGEDFSEMRIGMLPQLRKVAYGQLLPDALADYGHRPSVLRKLADLPPPDQAKVLKEGVEVAVVNGGNIEKVILPLGELNQQQLRAAMKPGRLPTFEEQAREQRFSKPAVKPPERMPYELVGKVPQLVVNRPTAFTKQDLELIIPRMFTRRDIQSILKAME